MALYKWCLKGKIAVILLMCISYTSAFSDVSRTSQELLRDPLQQAVQQDGRYSNAGQRHCASGRCMKPRRSHDDDRFLSYITSFAESPHGQLLDDIIRLQLSQSFEHADAMKFPKAGKGGSWSILDLRRFAFGYSSYIVDVIVLFVSAGCFIYIAVWNPLSNYFISAISSHVIVSLFMGLTHDVIPSWMCMILSLSLEAVICILLQYMHSSKRRRVCVFFSCTVKAKLLYDLLAMAPYEALSPSYTGIAGTIVINVFRTSNFMALRLVYAILLLAIAAAFYEKLPRYITSEPMEPEEVAQSSVALRKMVCFVAAWPVAALMLQGPYTLRKVQNPIGPYVFFFTPTPLRFNTLDGWLAVVTWGITSVALFEYGRQWSKKMDQKQLEEEQKWLESTTPSKASEF